jgi:hypothetical protein
MVINTIIQLYEITAPLLSLPFFTDQITYVCATHSACLNVSRLNSYFEPATESWHKKWGETEKVVVELAPELYQETISCGYGKDLWRKFNTDERIQRYLKLRALVD